ncbi:hypothetical protein DICSQDRAFT_167359 [Dichomitus squalens LYAD-421 SS1]|uniref:uncharacterized protein n=1 Tax=Dichomitus squalens (strain LYAD-421) TaxID=732165 RepID=UPI000441379D|nr:uncharacterized protein DICSQDRAFT_167359 [Dichomitus squalens LYAD-421 SS1]EJF64185.1 hypothetical protein DICSQDRAFT_167359 [Dichomitus squalens LYAD-421 SS1]
MSPGRPPVTIARAAWPQRWDVRGCDAEQLTPSVFQLERTLGTSILWSAFACARQGGGEGDFDRSTSPGVTAQRTIGRQRAVEHPSRRSGWRPLYPCIYRSQYVFREMTEWAVVKRPQTLERGRNRPGQAAAAAAAAAAAGTAAGTRFACEAEPETNVRDWSGLEARIYTSFPEEH